MISLTLDLFLNNDRDLEKNQFLILSALKNIKNNFSKLKLYPDLAALIDLNYTLQEILAHKSNLGFSPTSRSKNFDPLNSDDFFERLSSYEVNSLNFFEIIQWTLPKLNELLNEGLAINEFVDENITLAQVNGEDNLRDEGFIILTDKYSAFSTVFKYQFNYFSDQIDDLEAIVTTSIQNLNKNDLIEPNKIINFLKADFKESNYYSIYTCKKDLDLPFEETVLPIIKRKLLTNINNLV